MRGLLHLGTKLHLGEPSLLPSPLGTYPEIDVEGEKEGREGEHIGVRARGVVVPQSQKCLNFFWTKR